MLRAHSLLWHYLWVAPNILLLILGFLMWRRGLYRQIPAFFAFAILGALSESSVYAADMIPSIDGWTFWRIEWGSVLVIGLLKFVLIAEIFAHVFGPYAPVAKLGQGLIRSLGVVLVLAGTALAALAPPDGRFGLISDAHLSELAVYLVESGLLVFIFLFAAYFRLPWPRQQFGIALGLSISSCVHLATLALTNGGVTESKRMVLVFFNMTTYHAVVLTWFYYLLVPQKVIAKPVVPLPDHNLEVWNRELERLIQK
jgi:hypothetical protein